MTMPEIRETKRQLGPHDWIIAGFEALMRGGPDAIRVEAIARSLRATKGSFYWHFKDLKALHLAMLAAWERLATSSVTTPAHLAGHSASERLSWLIERVSFTPDDEQAGAALEPAVRDWGRVEPLAHAVLARVDRRRLTDLAALFIDAGLLRSEAQTAANRFYAALLGLEALQVTTAVDMAAVLRGIAEMALGRSLTLAQKSDLTQDYESPAADRRAYSPTSDMLDCQMVEAGAEETQADRPALAQEVSVNLPKILDQDVNKTPSSSTPKQPFDQHSTSHKSDAIVVDASALGPVEQLVRSPFKTVQPWTRAGP